MSAALLGFSSSPELLQDAPRFYDNGSYDTTNSFISNLMLLYLNRNLFF